MSNISGLSNNRRENKTRKQQRSEYMAIKPAKKANILCLLVFTIQLFYTLVHFSLGLNLVVRLHYALVLSKISFHVIFIVALQYTGAFLMLVRHLT